MSYQYAPVGALSPPPGLSAPNTPTYPPRGYSKDNTQATTHAIPYNPDGEVPKNPFSDPYQPQLGERYRSDTVFNVPAEDFEHHARTSSGSSRKRPIRYSSFAEAVHDDTASKFDPDKLYAGNESHYSLRATDDAFINSRSLSLGIPKPAKMHPFSNNFEPPKWKLLAVHTLFCLIAYPLLLAFVLVASSKPLFWCRVFVSAGCGVVGFMLAVPLLRMARTILEVATWATIIHQSIVSNGPGVKLKDLAAHTNDPLSYWSALCLLRDRFRYPGTRKHRRTYDQRPWSLYILFFMFLIALSASLPFIFGRLVTIVTQINKQGEVYEEIPIYGDISQNDIDNANKLQDAFNSFIFTWTLTPFSALGKLPPVVSFVNGNDTVYFSETALSQLLPNGNGFRTFGNATAVSTNQTSLEQKLTLTSTAGSGINPGTTIRYPRWGIRNRCARLPSAQTNILPHSESNMTYLFIPTDTIQNLFTELNMQLPDSLNAPFNASKVLLNNDTLPANLDVNSTALGAAFYDNGVTHSFFSVPINTGSDGNGWVSLETVLVRLNTSYAPNGTFPRYSDITELDASGNQTRIGYDAAVCLEVFEPWILDVYNSSIGVPNSARLLQKGGTVEDIGREERIGPDLTDPLVNQQLNSTSLWPIYVAAHQNSVNEVLKDNGRDAFYVPSPTVVSFTDGQGPFGYTELSPDIFAAAKAQSDATNALPYFAGSGRILARSYSDRVLSQAWIQNVEMAIALSCIFLIGVVAVLFVPKLPMAVPRRSFDIYSWLAAFYADELVGGQGAGISKNMEIEDIAQQVGNLKFRYSS